MAFNKSALVIKNIKWGQVSMALHHKDQEFEGLLLDYTLIFEHLLMDLRSTLAIIIFSYLVISNVQVFKVYLP